MKPFGKTGRRLVGAGIIAASTLVGSGLGLVGHNIQLHDHAVAVQKLGTRIRELEPRIERLSKRQGELKEKLEMQRKELDATRAEREEKANETREPLEKKFEEVWNDIVKNKPHKISQLREIAPRIYGKKSKEEIDRALGRHVFAEMLSPTDPSYGLNVGGIDGEEYYRRGQNAADEIREHPEIKPLYAAYRKKEDELFTRPYDRTVGETNEKIRSNEKILIGIQKELVEKKEKMVKRQERFDRDLTPEMRRKYIREGGGVGLFLGAFGLGAAGVFNYLEKRRRRRE